MATSEADIAAQLIERLLGDPAFRAEFRRDPASACRKAGLDELADEMSIGAGKAMMTLDQRESKSSLAGVMMAAAMEGVGIYQFGEHVLPHIDDVPSAVGDVLSRVSLPAIDLKGALAGGAGRAGGRRPAEANGADGRGRGRRAPAAAAPPRPPRRAAAPAGGGAARGGRGGGRQGRRGEGGRGAARAGGRGKAAAKIAAAESPEAKQRRGRRGGGGEDQGGGRRTSPTPTTCPTRGVAPQEVEEVGPGASGRGARPRRATTTAHEAPAPRGRARRAAEAAAAQPAPPAAVETAAGRRRRRRGRGAARRTRTSCSTPTRRRTSATARSTRA